MVNELQINFFKDIYWESYQDILIALEISSQWNLCIPLAFKTSLDQELGREWGLQVCFCCF